MAQSKVNWAALYPYLNRSPVTGEIPALKKNDELQQLYQLAVQQGGPVATKARAILEPQITFWGKVKNFTTGALWKVIKALNVFSGIEAGILDPDKTIKEAVEEGAVPSDIIFEGIEPKTKLGKAGLFIAKLATDILLDPLTYVTFGAGSSILGVRATAKVGGKALTKEGEKLLMKGIKQGLKGGLSEDFVKQSFLKMMETHPELAKRFIDKGGIKFFGKTILSGQRIRTIVESIPGYKKIDLATQPVRHKIASLFWRDVSPRVGKLPQELVRTREKFLDLAAVKSEEAIDKLLNLAVRNNLSMDELNIIRNSIEAGSIVADKRLRRAQIEIMRLLGIARKEEAKRGILRSFLENYVPHILVDEKPTKIPITPLKRLPFAKHRTIKKTIEEVNKEFGKEFFDENLLRGVAKRLVASQRAIAAKDFYDEVIRKFGVLAKEAPSGYVVPKVAYLKKYAFHPAVAQYLEQAERAFISDEPTRIFLRAFDKLQNIYKASVTSVFPAFNGRNAISNVFQNFLDIGYQSVNPKMHFQSIKLLFWNEKAKQLAKIAEGTGDEAVKAKKLLAKLLSKKVAKDRFGDWWTFGELRQLIKNNRVAFGSEFLGFMDIDIPLSEKIGKLSKTSLAKKVAKKTLPISQEFIPFKVGRRVANLIEEQARLVNFLANLEKTGDPVLAAKRVKMFLFDYRNLTPFEKNVLRRLIPFYTWTRKNLELQVRALLTVPGRVAIETKLLKTLGDVISGNAQLTKKEEELLPSWIKSGIGILAKKNGETLTILGSLQTPFEQPFQFFQANQLLGSISPLIKLPIELATGYSWFYGKPLSEITNAAAFVHAPQAVKNFIGFRKLVWTDQRGKQHVWYISLNPERMYLLMNLPPTSRVFSSLKQIENVDLDTGYKVLQQLTGVRPYKFDLERIQRQKEKEAERKLVDLLERVGVVYRLEKPIVRKNI